MNSCEVRLVVGCLVLALTIRPALAGLRFNEANQFKIIQFADLHFGECANKDAKTVKAMAEVLSAEPDANLVVLTGDQVSGSYWDKSPGWYAKQYAKLTAPLVAAGIPWTMTLGNHDDEADLSRQEIVALDQSSSVLSLTRSGPTELTGASNYWLSIMSSKGNREALRLWWMDSMDQGCYIPFGWGCVGRDTLSWVKDQGSSVPSVAFIHIPVPQFMDAWEGGSVNGSKAEWTNCPHLDSLTFKTLKEEGVRAIYSGHDHANAFSALWEGVRLAYGHKSGYGSYGPPAGWQHGARVIVLREGQDPAHSDSYIRLEDGSQAFQAPSTRKRSWFPQPYCLPDVLGTFLHKMTYWQQHPAPPPHAVHLHSYSPDTQGHSHAHGQGHSQEFHLPNTRQPHIMKARVHPEGKRVHTRCHHGAAAAAASQQPSSEESSAASTADAAQPIAPPQ